MKKPFLKSSDITDIAMLAALLTVAGAIKLPSLLPGLEFQISAPLAVAICFVFGFKKYILVGILSSAISLALGTHNLFNVAIAMQFRLMVGLVYVLCGKHYWSIALAGPIGTGLPLVWYWAKGYGHWWQLPCQVWCLPSLQHHLW